MDRGSIMTVYTHEEFMKMIREKYKPKEKPKEIKSKKEPKKSHKKM